VPLTYTEYLQIDALLGLQRPLSKRPEHDETLFIIVHQVYELWFKQLLHELDYTQSSLDSDDLPTASACLKRVLTILKTLVSQVDIIETMTPLSFNAFRDRLESSSGFQSVQFRVLELRLGRRSARWEHIHPEGSPAREAFAAARARPSLYNAFLRFLSRNGSQLPLHALIDTPDRANVEDPEVRAALIQIYRTQPSLAQICERLVDLDEGLQEWRYRHVKMVERTIGHKVGTGGSAGAAYLQSTLFSALFPDLWAIRSEF
jgi:tryptophan 2,3-dioxygenase